jgi:hypothetical protein
LGPLHRKRQPSPADGLPPRRAQEAECRHLTVGGPQKGRSSADLNGTPRHSRLQAATGLLFRCVRQADRVR